MTTAQQHTEERDHTIARLRAVCAPGGQSTWMAISKFKARLYTGAQGGVCDHLT